MNKTTREDGGMAFPGSRIELGPITNTLGECEYYGLSVRDYFAGQALAGLLADRDTLLARTATLPPGLLSTTAAMLAYQIADAMLKERTK